MGGSGAQACTARGILGLSPLPVGAARVLLPASLALLALCLACETGAFVRQDDGVLRHRERGFAIGPPPASDPPWHRIDVKGATLAYQREEDELLSLRVSCSRPQAAPRILARHLRIGVGRHVVRSESAVTHAGLEGWSQIFDVGDPEAGGVIVRVQSVTLLDGPCTVDFIVSAPDSFDAVVQDFDRWWRSYRPMQGGGA